MSKNKKKHKDSEGEIARLESQLSYLFKFGASRKDKMKALQDALWGQNHGGISNSMGFEMGNAKPSARALHWDKNRQNRDTIKRLFELLNNDE